MKLTVVTVDFEVTAQTKRRAAVATTIVAATIGAIGVAMANVPHTFSAGEVLSSAKLNANFAALETKLNANFAASETVSFYGSTGATTALTGTPTTINFTPITDTHSAYSSGTFTVPVSGRYEIISHAPMYSAATPGNGFFSVYKNGVAQNSAAYVVTTVAGQVTIAVTLYLGSYVAGDLITVQMYKTVGGLQLLGSAVGAYATCSIKRVGS